jgi:hypothetical protein
VEPKLHRFSRQEESIMNWTPFVIAWVALGVATAGLALYRKLLTMKEDDYIHIEDWRAPEVTKQEVAARRFHSIDRLGETLTITTVAAGVCLAVAYAAVALLH